MYHRLSVSVGVVAILARLASAADRDVVASLDVPPGEAPGYLCVVALHRPCIPGTDCSVRKVESIQTREVVAGTIAVTGFDDKTAPKGLQEALASLAKKEYDDRCTQTHKACRPMLRLGKFASGFITCSNHNQDGNDRVAVLGVEFGSELDNPSGVNEIKLVGTKATLTFKNPVAKNASLFFTVLGGHYAFTETSELGTNTRVNLSLQPRCSSYVVEIPGARAPIDEVEISSASLGKQTCTAATETERPLTLPIRIPYTPSNEQKILRVTYDTHPETESLATWVTSSPPSPLRLSARSFEFKWKRPNDCLADRWSEVTPPYMVQTWNETCPRATISLGSACVLAGSTDDYCRYSCSVDPHVEALAYPIPVRFDRIRLLESAELVVYSWTDEVRFSGQELTSVVAPQDRRVMLEFGDRRLWSANMGVMFDAIRILNGSRSTDQLDLTEAAPPPWTALATPHRTCTDRLRLAVFGTRIYRETSHPVVEGRLLLPRPKKFQSDWHHHLSLGTGLEWQRSTGHPFAEAGYVISYDDAGPWSVVGDVSAQIIGRSYQGIELPSERGQDETLALLRATGRLQLEYWALPRFHLYGGAGFSVSFPYDVKDDRRFGFLQRSYPFEVGLLARLIRRRSWLQIGFGARLLEEEINYGTDFTGAPTPARDREIQPYLTLRFRVRMG